MKTVKSKPFLIISSCHLGMSEDILQIFANYQKKYKAQVIHLGPTVTDKEFAQYEKLSRELTKLEVAESDGTLTERQAEAIEDKIRAVEFERNVIRDGAKQRLEMLERYFGKDIIYVSTEKLSIQFEGRKWKLGGLELSRYLYLSPIPPTGMKSTRTPISSTAVAYLKDLGRSWIVAHPVPSVVPIPKPGLNNVWSCYSVGSLRHQAQPARTNEQYQHAHMPCAIFVLVDAATGEFHPKQLHIDYLSGKFTKQSRAVVIDDGLAFTTDKVIVLDSEDKATFSTDDHAPYQHPGVLGSLRALNDLHEPRTFINGGDAADFESVNRHTEDLPGEREGCRLEDDLTALRKLLDAQTNSKSIQNKVLIDSNHHEWVTLLVERMPALKGMCDWRTLAATRFPDWDLMIREAGDTKIYYFGDMPIRHGDRDGGVKRAEQIYPSGKYLCGHWHQHVSYRRATQVGCGCKLGPKYISGQVNAWQNQITTLSKYQGVTSAAPKVVLHDKKRDVSRFAYRGEIYEVKHYVIK